MDTHNYLSSRQLYTTQSETQIARQPLYAFGRKSTSGVSFSVGIVVYDIALLCGGTRAELVTFLKARPAVECGIGFS